MMCFLFFYFCYFRLSGSSHSHKPEVWLWFWIRCWETRRLGLVLGILERGREYLSVGLSGFMVGRA